LDFNRALGDAGCGTGSQRATAHCTSRNRRAYQDRPRSIRCGKSAPRRFAASSQELASDFIILGSYLALGNDTGQIRLDLRLEDSTTGQTVAAISETATEKAIVDLASQVGSRLRGSSDLRTFPQSESVGLRAELPSNPEQFGSIRKDSPRSAHLMRFRPETYSARRRCRSLLSTCARCARQGVVIPRLRL